MALDPTQPIRAIDIKQRDGTLFSIRVGVNLVTREIVVEENGVERPATDAETKNYIESNSLEATIAQRDIEVKNAVSAIVDPAVKAYLQTKFPEDFR